jgi:hypothetical protein
MEFSNCSRSRGRGNYLDIPFGNAISLSGSGEVMKNPQPNNQHSDITYKNLYKHARPDGIVRLEQESQFFVITDPTKLNSFRWNAPFLGWKIHLSISNPQKNLATAFELVMPILLRYGLCFKVINLKEIGDERFLQGEQITIYPEEEGELAVTVEEVRQMMEDIHRAFLLNGIEPGTIPASDAQMLSPFLSARCDICKPLLNRSLPPGYVPAHVAGNHFNPMNYPNPYGELFLKENTKPFDPMEHLLSFNLDINDGNIYYRLIDTMKACINVYTNFETLSEESKELFILQYCHENGNNNVEFFKEEYKNKPEILLAVKQAFTIVFMFEADSSVSKSWYLNYVNSAQFPKQYPFKNSFRDLLKILEGHINKQIERYMLIQVERLCSLMELYLNTKGMQKDSIFPLRNIGQYDQLSRTIK